MPEYEPAKYPPRRPAPRRSQPDREWNGKERRRSMLINASICSVLTALINLAAVGGWFSTGESVGGQLKRMNRAVEVLRENSSQQTAAITEVQNHIEKASRGRFKFKNRVQELPPWSYLGLGEVSAEAPPVVQVEP